VSPRGGEASPSAGLILDTLQEVYRGPAWYGSSLRRALGGVSVELATWRPGTGRNTIWEIVLHLAYTRHRLLLRLTHFDHRHVERFPRPLRKAWWPSLPDEITEKSWRADRELLDAYQEHLVQAVRETPEPALARRRPGKKVSLGREMLGHVMHDAYHTGQIRLVRVLAGGSRPG